MLGSPGRDDPPLRPQHWLSGQPHLAPVVPAINVVLRRCELDHLLDPQLDGTLLVRDGRA